MSLQLAGEFAGHECLQQRSGVGGGRAGQVFGIDAQQAGALLVG